MDLIDSWKFSRKACRNDDPLNYLPGIIFFRVFTWYHFLPRIYHLDFQVNYTVCIVIATSLQTPA